MHAPYGVFIDEFVYSWFNVSFNDRGKEFATNL